MTPSILNKFEPISLDQMDQVALMEAQGYQVYSSCEAIAIDFLKDSAEINITYLSNQ
ncbi:MAG: hypothetical protein P8O20_01935 [Bacteroidia bacterium]|nr:hypothetical protein [Bacteroidia bacterium]